MLTCPVCIAIVANFHPTPEPTACGHDGDCPECTCFRAPVVNQCMGCQAGWPLDDQKYSSVRFHKVVGGYPGELVGCTAGRYIAPADDQVN